MKTMYKKLKKGSSTIEASFLIPIILWILILLIYLAFFFYNKLLVEEVSYIAALRASQLEWSSASQKYDEAQRSMEELLKNKLIAIKKYEKKIQVGATKIEISIKVNQPVPLRSMISRYYQKGTFEYNASQKAKCLKPYQYIRMVRGFSNE